MLYTANQNAWTHSLWWDALLPSCGLRWTFQWLWLSLSLSRSLFPHRCSDEAATSTRLITLTCGDSPVCFPACYKDLPHSQSSSDLQLPLPELLCPDLDQPLLLEFAVHGGCFLVTFFFLFNKLSSNAMVCSPLVLYPPSFSIEWMRVPMCWYTPTLYH